MTSHLAVVFGTSDLYTCSAIITDYTSDTVTVKYSGLPANQPATYENYIAIWEASMIPWNVPPITFVDIGINAQTGSVVLQGLVITRSSYIVGYSVGPDVTNIACSNTISLGGMIVTPQHISISIQNIGTTSITIHYQTLAGYLPNQYNNWIGIWKGLVSPYNAPDPIGYTPIYTNNTEGSVGINNIQLGINSNYTLIYFTGAAYSSAAAILNFSTANFLMSE
ncbi:hypothetical protein [Chitinophaga nivalis]|uniref:Uncharacterized protein n=1 Tax=Chitinophaga nivalis TaxID=2991709 RepID=A0ABT3INC3_9BACT|nr:hypothetical protein [Chitinophaga nivalis]MCW3464862.1 hypothetical protein [Chitinophaga nivalis]MCW3485447.1 hypothetical protein [Chitinophaga nivalis]